MYLVALNQVIEVDRARFAIDLGLEYDCAIFIDVYRILFQSEQLSDLRRLQLQFISAFFGRLV